MTDEAERRRRTEALKRDLRLQRALDEAGRGLAADPYWRAAQDRMNDPEQRRHFEQWQEANDLLNEAARELEREEEGLLAPPETPQPATNQGHAPDLRSLPEPELPETLGELHVTEAPDVAVFAGWPEPMPSPPATLSKAQGDELIRIVLGEIYDEADRNNTKPPSKPELWELRARFKERGVQHLTQERLYTLANEFKERRLRPGVRWHGKPEGS